MGLRNHPKTTKYVYFKNSAKFMDEVWEDNTSYECSMGRQNKLWMEYGKITQAMDGVWGVKTNYGRGDMEKTQALDGVWKTKQAMDGVWGETQAMDRVRRETQAMDGVGGDNTSYEWSMGRQNKLWTE